MERHLDRLDVRARAREKEASRLADERAVSSGRKPADELRSENEAVASLARSARVNLPASHSLG